MVTIIRYLCAILIGFSLGITVTHSSQDSKFTDDEAPFSILNDVLNSVSQFYVDDVDIAQLEMAAVEGILTSLDPYSDYLNKDDLAVFYDNSKGQYFGYGIEVSIKNDLLTIITPLANSPAAAAGIQAGDVIKKINNNPVTLAEVDKLLLSIKQSSNDGLPIELEIYRDNQSLLKRLLPANIMVASVTSTTVTEDTQLIKLHNFNEDTSQQFEAALEQLPITNKNIILDLRNNPGGLLREAISIADMFITEGTIVKTSGRFKYANREYIAQKNKVQHQQQLIVLINKGSASAAEVLAAALQENGRAKLIGQTSFGKGTVQSVLPSQPAGTALKLTTARYYTPNKNDIHDVGITPDIIVDPASKMENRSLATKITDPVIDMMLIEDKSLFKALEILNQQSNLIAVNN
ncbi:S41 family peptidase [Paraferrimonas sp. SM1919]|uniref:S41 family peptidase n=1 Tax=Paraferrimonas sp. SM1919 TaxID=2662263 RepID=UPI0013D258E0|nr:S41 family peptidase [Paraferrimonas sp. SM1919]